MGFGVPFVRRADQQPESRIPDLLMEQGRAAARGAENSGAIWGGAVQGLGQIAGQAVQQHAELKEQSKRSKAFEAALATGDPKDIIRVLGPKDGPAVVNALRASTPDGMKQYSDRMAIARDIARGALAVPPDNRAQAIEFGKNSLLQAGVFKPEELPKVIDEAFLRQLAAYGEAPKDKAPLSGGPGTVYRDPDTLGVLAENPAAPKEPKRHMGTVPGPDGKPMFRLMTEEELAGGVPAYREPKEPKAQNLERIETVGPDGKPVTTWVEPKAGATYAKPTGAGKPATGQQRRALGFFNRGKEAGEIADQLEEGGTINPSLIKFIPEFLNVLRSNPDQAYVQAQRAFTEARLRKDSGAAVPEHEYKTDALTYFAQPGDSEATKAQKRAGRNAILAGIAFESGDALREFYGDEAEGMIAGYQKASNSGRQAGPKQIKNDAEYAALPSGTEFVGPDGKRRRKP